MFSKLKAIDGIKETEARRNYLEVALMEQVIPRLSGIRQTGVTGE